LEGANSTGKEGQWVGRWLLGLPLKKKSGVGVWGGSIAKEPPAMLVRERVLTSRGTKDQARKGLSTVAENEGLGDRTYW